MAAETGFLIDGTVYEVPTMASFSLAERHVMYDLCDLVPEDFMQEDDEDDDDYEARTERMARHPGYWQTLMQIAYQRGNPGVKPGKARLVIEGTEYFDAISTLREDEPQPEEDAVPLALTRPPDEPLPSEPSSKTDSTPPSSESGGTASTNGSDPPAVLPTPIGITRSDTSSPESPTKESVA